MQTRDRQLLTTLLLLAVMALVGGVGTGLHSWFGCCHGPNLLGFLGGSCHAPSSRSELTDRSAHPSECSSSAWREAEQTSDGLDCPICTLLSRYHATPSVIENGVAGKAIFAWLDLGKRPLPRSKSIHWGRPRGPPSSANLVA